MKQVEGADFLVDHTRSYFRKRRRRLLEDLSLIEFTALGVLAYPLEILIYKFLGFIRVSIQFPPVITFIIDGPISA